MKFRKSLKNKIISYVMAVAMVMTYVLVYPGKTVNAEGEGIYTPTEDVTLEADSVITDDSGAECTLADISVMNVTGGLQVTIAGTGVGHSSLTVNIGDGSAVIVETGAALTASSISGNLVNEGTVNANTILFYQTSGSGMVANNGTINVSGTVSVGNRSTFENRSGATLSAGSISTEEDTSFNNYGIVKMSSFNTTKLGEGLFTNANRVIADTVYLTTAVRNDTTAQYEVSDSITITGYNSEYIGDIYANPGTRIACDGGGFNLYVGDLDPAPVSGGVDTTAIELAGLDNDISLDEVYSVYVGEEYDFTELVVVDENYDGTFYLEYAEDGEEDFTTKKPTAAGSYRVHAVAPATNKYKTAMTELQDFDIEYLPLDECDSFDDGNYLEAINVGNGIYAQDNFMLKPAAGYAVKLDGSGQGFVDSITFVEDDLYDSEGDFIDEIHFSLKSLGDNAETDVYKWSDIYDKLDQIVFDYDAPDIIYVEIDGEESEMPADYKVVAKSMEIVVGDENINVITVNDEPVAIAETSFDMFGATLDYNAIAGTDQTFSIYASDMSGRETHINFTLVYKKDEPTATVTVDDLYAGETVNPVLTTNSDGEDDAVFEYRLLDETEDDFTTEAPEVAGEYVVRATIPETDLYEEAVCEDEFKVLRNATTASVEIDDMEIGTDYEPVITTNSDGKADTAYDYKLKSAGEEAFDGEKPTAAGIYTVRATVPETGKYEEAVCYDDFEIFRKTATYVDLTVDDVYVGDDYEPELSTDHDGADDVKYTYKVYGTPDTTLTDVKPSTAGHYVVLATLDETDNYNAASATDDFYINKRVDTSAQVTVPDTKVGTEYEPVLTCESDGKEEAVFEYKPFGAEDDEYSEEQPKTAGQYTVRATIPETEAYEEVICDSSFTISKKTAATLSVAVSDTTVGQEYEPVLTTDHDGKADAIFEYRIDGDEESEFSETKPTEVGEYVILATLPETDAYEAADCTNTFKIKKISGKDASVTVADTVIGTEYEPVLSTDSDGKSRAVFEYKLYDADDSEYEEAKPTAAGKYMVRATVPETDTYEEQVCTGSFTISKKTAEASVTVNDTLAGEEYDPVLTTDSNGKKDAVFEYKLSGADDSEYSGTKPVDAGTYTVRVTVPETDIYNKVVATAEFTITRKGKKISDAEVSVHNTFVGQDYNPVLRTESDGKGRASFEYKLSDAEDRDYSEEKPVWAGEYTVRATVPETDTYEKQVCTATFTISRKTPATAVVKVGNSFVGQDYNPALITDSDGKAEAAFVYRAAGSDDVYTAEKPTAAGTYEVVALIPQTNYYEAARCSSEFTISRYSVTAKVIIGTVLAGTQYTPTVETASDGIGDVKFKYKPADAPDDAYSIYRPTAAGTYTVCAIVSATETYEEAVAYADFSVVYLDPPENAYTFVGTRGKNDFYISDVFIQPATGYNIAYGVSGDFTGTVKYDENNRTVHLRRTSDGAITSGVQITQQLKIDKDKPVIGSVVEGGSNTPNITSGMAVFNDLFILGVSDLNLASVTVSDSESSRDETVSDGKARLELNPENGIKKFTITAEDLAGNTETFEVVVMAEWLIERVVPGNKEVPLDPGEEYYLGAGSWVVNGDPTVYSGGITIYVNSEGKYTFRSN